MHHFISPYIASMLLEHTNSGAPMKRLFPSLPDAPVLGDVFQAFPAHIAPLLAYHGTLLRGPSMASRGLEMLGKPKG